jgi:hypothetical protein
MFRDFDEMKHAGDFKQWKAVLRVPEGGNVEDAEMEEFELLLAQSSLGTPTAQATRALTPQHVYDRLERHLAEDGDVDDVAMVPDADDVVLDVVRSAVEPDLPDSLPMSCMVVLVSSCLRPERDIAEMAHQVDRWLRLCADVRSYRVASAEYVLHDLLGHDVFSFVRPDVARSIVDIGFGGAGKNSWAVLHACTASLSSSLIDDELASSVPLLLQAAVRERAMEKRLSFLHVRLGKELDFDAVRRSWTWNTQPPPGEVENVPLPARTSRYVEGARAGHRGGRWNWRNWRSGGQYLGRHRRGRSARAAGRGRRVRRLSKRSAHPPTIWQMSPSLLPLDQHPRCRPRVIGEVISAWMARAGLVRHLILALVFLLVVADGLY